MSDYSAVLSARNVPRDAHCEIPPKDEDEPSGILRRKLEVNFGSKFRKLRSRGGRTPGQLLGEETERLADIDGLASALAGSGADSDEKEDTSNGGMSQVLQMASSLFCDTPNPYTNRDDDSLRFSDDDTSSSNYISDDEGDRYASPASPMYTPPQSPIAYDVQQKVARTSYSQHSPHDESTQDRNTRDDYSGESSNSSYSNSVQTTDDSEYSDNNYSKPSEECPPGWTKYYSERQGRHYWYNETTEQSVWELPGQ